LDPPPRRASFVRVGATEDTFVFELTNFKDPEDDQVTAKFYNYPDFLLPKYGDQFLFTSR